MTGRPAGSGRDANLAATPSPGVLENTDAPCNICGRGWPYHYHSCAYLKTAEDAARYSEALERIEHEALHFDANRSHTKHIRAVATDALRGPK